MWDKATRCNRSSVRAAFGKLADAIKDFGDAVADAMESLAELTAFMAENAEDLRAIAGDDDKFIHNTIEGATLGDTRAWIDWRGVDTQDGKDVIHRESPCIYVNRSETN